MSNVTLASRAANLLTKAGALDVVSKAIDQAIKAKRVHPALATDFGAQLGVELPLKTREFIRVVGHLLAASDKPLKGAISKRKHEILLVLAELVGALTDTQPIALPEWAHPKVREKKAEAADNAEAAASGALERANTLAAAEAAAEKAAASADLKLAQAVTLIIERAAELSAAQRDALLAVLTTESAEA